MPEVVPLGDQAALCYCRDEAEAARLAAAVRRLAPAWLLDVVQAYSSVAVFYDLERVGFQAVAAELHAIDCTTAVNTTASRLHLIPCCYELALDLERVAAHTGLTAARIIELHSGTTYTVYAIGFCPGFPYLGYLPEALAGVPRLPAPRLRVEAGSVGLTGRQTGIYTEQRPGGWNIVGRTPLELVNVRDGYFPLRTGDQVRFVAIARAEFDRLQGNRL